MFFHRIPVLLTLVLLIATFPAASGAVDDKAESRPAQVQDLNTPRVFPTVDSPEDWHARAREIREQVLVSCGLWPLPEKSPLQPHIFGKLERDGYSIEKVYFQTCPGFYLAGNLYRPLGHGNGPFPAILNPHGHWNDGRFADAKDGSIPARCISFARQGMIAFSYDMVGFNDTRFADTPAGRPFYEVHRQVFTNRADLLWNITLMGLQTWNSVRALDFLKTLHDADPRRLACTGESGGGTQTFMLGAIDDRLAAQVPVVMVSHLMQGGCLCENAPGLRVEYSNMEIAASVAPRPQFLVAATGDWTKDTPTVEGPAIQGIYHLLGAERNFDFVQFDFGHNYNQTSREAVYAWFAKWLRHAPRGTLVKEAPYQKEPNDALRVFPEGHLPPDAVTEGKVAEYWKELHREQWGALVPHDRDGLKRFKEVVFPAWRRTLQVEWPKNRVEIQLGEPKIDGASSVTSCAFRRLGEEAQVRGHFWAPAGLATNSAPKVVVMSQPPTGEDAGAFGDAFRARLAQSGIAVLTINQFSSAVPAAPFSNFFSTYNRTEAQSRVRDLITVCSAAGSLVPQNRNPPRIILYGRGSGGAWSVMAAPAADAVIADLALLAGEEEETWLTPSLFCPGILNLGGIEGPAMLGAPHPLLLHHVRAKFDSRHLRAAYEAGGASANLRLESQELAPEEIITWLAGLK